MHGHKNENFILDFQYQIFDIRSAVFELLPSQRWRKTNRDVEANKGITRIAAFRYKCTKKKTF